MGANSATKLHRIILNLQRILAIELLNAVQAIEFRRPLKSSTVVEKIISEYRKVVSRNTVDRVLAIDIQNSVTFLQALNSVN